jgi:hypothetical protein
MATYMTLAPFVGREVSASVFPFVDRPLPFSASRLQREPIAAQPRPWAVFGKRRRPCSTGFVGLAVGVGAVASTARRGCPNARIRELPP